MPDAFEHTPTLTERRIDALMMLLRDKQRSFFTTDENRRTIESLTPEHYNASGYYEKWAFAMYKLAWCFYNVGDYGKGIDTMKAVGAKNRPFPRPAKVGSARIDLATGLIAADGAAEARAIVAESRAAAQQLEQQRHQLADELTGSGLRGAAIDIGLGSGTSPDGGPGRDGAGHQCSAVRRATTSLTPSWLPNNTSPCRKTLRIKAVPAWPGWTAARAESMRRMLPTTFARRCSSTRACFAPRLRWTRVWRRSRRSSPTW